MQEQVSSSTLVADFFTHSYRISGRVNVRHRKLADQLNDPTSSFLQIENAYISNIEHPADIATSHTDSVLAKYNVTAVIIPQQEDGLARERSYGSYFGTYTRRVFLTLPGFQVAGSLRLSGKLDLRTVLTTGTDNFIVVVDGEMKSSIRTDVTFSGGAILVNKKHIGAFCIVEEE